MNFYPINLFLQDVEMDEEIIRQKERLDSLPPLSESVEFVEKHNNSISITRSES